MFLNFDGHLQFCQLKLLKVVKEVPQNFSYQKASELFDRFFWILLG